jgi:hypothetical protein
VNKAELPDAASAKPIKLAASRPLCAVIVAGTLNICPRTFARPPVSDTASGLETLKPVVDSQDR